jgi:hypothetical protein
MQLSEVTARILGDRHADRNNQYVEREITRWPRWTRSRRKCVDVRRRKPRTLVQSRDSLALRRGTAVDVTRSSSSARFPTIETSQLRRPGRQAGATPAQIAADRVLGPDTLRARSNLPREAMLNVGVCEAAIGAEIGARDLTLIPRHDRLQNAVPSVGAVDVTRAQGGAFQIANWLKTNSG